MKQLLFILLATCFVALGASAQPLFQHSQFDLPQKFSALQNYVERTYNGKTVCKKLPANTPTFSQGLIDSIRLSPVWWAEREIPLHKTLYSFLDKDSVGYTLVCPRYDHCNKLIAGLWRGGFELIWQMPEGDFIYVIVNTCSRKEGCTSFAAMRTKHKTIQDPTKAEIDDLFNQFIQEMHHYVDTAYVHQFVVLNSQ